MMKPKLHTLRSAVMLPFTLLLLLTVSIITLVQNSSYERMQSKISAKLLNSYSENIKTNLDHFLEQPFDTTLAIADNIQRNQLYQASDLTKIEDYLHSAISDIYYQQKQISTISFGSENKDYVGFSKNEDQDVSLILKDKRTNYELEFYHGESSDDIVDYSISNYDPTTRPWYAPFAKEKAAGWAKIYSNVDEKNTFTISSISPVINDDTLVGIVATDINLRHLSHFIEPENRHFKGITYITDNQNKLIASSLKASLTDNDNNRIQAKESHNTVIAANGLYIANRQLQNKHAPATFEFDQNGIRYFSRITAYSNNNLQWFIIVTLPENVLLDGLPNQQRLGLVAALTLAFFGLLMGLYLLRIITQPIMDIAAISQLL